MASSGGARPLHRLTKVRAIPAPEVAIGVQSGDPVIIVQQEVDMYRKLWGARKEASTAWQPDRNSCPRLSAEEIRRVSRSFPASTSASLDNFHPRHAAMLDDEGLEVLSSIWEASEALGVYHVNFVGSKCHCWQNPKVVTDCESCMLACIGYGKEPEGH